VYAPRLASRSVRVIAVALVSVTAAGGIFPATAGAAPADFPAGGLTASFTVSGALDGVAATSARNAWAVGFTGSGLHPQALIVHWNGTAWKRVASPSPKDSVLSGVAAASARSAWAVGRTGSGKTLILHWNGTAWKRVASPNPGSFADLAAVAAVSARSAWAVGELSGDKTLILRWNGTAWKRVASPSPGSFADLAGVAAASASNAWAVGSTGSLSSPGTLIEHWNGRTWKRVASPNPGGAENPNALRGVAAVSARSAFAVGCITCATASGFNQPLIEAWNGTAWRRAASSALGAPGGILSGVAATSARSAWAVGGTENGTGASERIRTLIARWNGTAWRRVPSPSPGTGAALFGVAVVSARSAWAVGDDSHSGEKSLILRWNGTAWK
jgi:hypothetical protein